MNMKNKTSPWGCSYIISLLFLLALLVTGCHIAYVSWVSVLNTPYCLCEYDEPVSIDEYMLHLSDGEKKPADPGPRKWEIPWKNISDFLNGRVKFGARGMKDYIHKLLD